MRLPPRAGLSGAAWSVMPQIGRYGGGFEWWRRYSVGLGRRAHSRLISWCPEACYRRIRRYALLNVVGGLLGGTASLLYQAWPIAVSNFVWALVGI